MKKKLFFVLRLLFGLGLLAYLIVARSNLGEIFAALRQARWLMLALAFSMHGLGLLILTLRWRMILAARGADYSFFQLMLFNLVAKFFNLFLPSSFGGDLMRIADTRHIRDGLPGSFAVVVYERMSGIFALTVYALIASLARIHLIRKLPFIPLALALGAAAMLLFAFLSTTLPRNLLQRIPARHRFLQRLFGALDRVHGVLADCLKNRTLLFKTLYSAFLLQLNVVLYYFFIGRALGLGRIPFIDHFFAIPILVIFLTIPISIGGIGVRDLILIELLSLYGYPPSPAIAFAFVDVLFNLILGIVGGLIYIFRKK